MTSIHAQVRKEVPGDADMHVVVHFKVDKPARGRFRASVSLKNFVRGNSVKEKDVFILHKKEPGSWMEALRELEVYFDPDAPSAPGATLSGFKTYEKVNPGEGKQRSWT